MGGHEVAHIFERCNLCKHLKTHLLLTRFGVLSGL